MCDNSFVKILCKKLPADVSNAILSESDSRWKDIENIWTFPHNKYQVLKEYEATVQHLLTMSIFYRRVLSGFDGARDFYKTVSVLSESQSKLGPVILIGKTELDNVQYNKLLGVQIEFNKIKKRFGIDDSFFEFFDTEEFLMKCKGLYLAFNKPESDQENHLDGKSDDFPF